MVTCEPGVAGLDETEVTVVATVKGTPLLARFATVTTTLPVVAPLGTVAVMPVALQFIAVPAGVPLNVTVLAPFHRHRDRWEHP